MQMQKQSLKSGRSVPDSYLALNCAGGPSPVSFFSTSTIHSIFSASTVSMWVNFRKFSSSTSPTWNVIKICLNLAETIYRGFCETNKATIIGTFSVSFQCIKRPTKIHYCIVTLVTLVKRTLTGMTGFFGSASSTTMDSSCPLDWDGCKKIYIV